MKKLLSLFGLMVVLTCFGTPEIAAQKSHPDKFINYLKKEKNAYALTLPGWFVRLGSSLAVHDLEDDEAAFVEELTSNIKKIRFVVLENLPENFENEFKSFKTKMTTGGYEPLIEAKDDGALIYLWAHFKGNTIQHMVVSILNKDDNSVFFNIKSDIDMDHLKQMNFFKEWSSL